MMAMKTSNEQYQHSQSSDRDFKIIISNIRHTIMHTHTHMNTAGIIALSA